MEKCLSLLSLSSWRKRRVNSVNRWEQFAQENAEWYILTEERFREGADAAAFYASGEESARDLYQRVAASLPGHRRAVEIGCGVGRLTFPHSRIFDEVHAVDVSPTMLQRLRERDGGSGKVRTFLPDEAWDEAAAADYCYSIMVFQHIPEEAVIVDYLQRIATTLKPGGIAQLHFDTRLASITYLLRNHLPDCLLPRSQRHGLRRIRRKRDRLLQIFRQFGLEVVHEIAPNSPNQLFILRKP
jgi:SAM-dependent methyltransferase